MTVTTQARAKLSFYWTMLVGTLVIAIIIGAMTAWSFTLKAVTAFQVLFWGLLIVAHSLNRRDGRYDLPQ